MNGALKVSLEQESPIPVDASFECAPGDILALVGPSGSGKSTLLRAIAGLNKVQSGRIECGGKYRSVIAALVADGCRARVGGSVVCPVLQPPLVEANWCWSVS